MDSAISASTSTINGAGADADSEVIVIAIKTKVVKGERHDDANLSTTAVGSKSCVSLESISSDEEIDLTRRVPKDPITEPVTKSKDAAKTNIVADMKVKTIENSGDQKNQNSGQIKLIQPSICGFSQSPCSQHTDCLKLSRKSRIAEPKEELNSKTRETVALTVFETLLPFYRNKDIVSRDEYKAVAKILAHKAVKNGITEKSQLEAFVIRRFKKYAHLE